MDKEVKERAFYTKKAVILMIAVIAMALWGSAFPAIKIGYKVFRITDGTPADRFVFAGVRFLLAGILVLIYNSIANKRIILPQKSDMGGILLLSFVQTVLEYVFFYVSLANLSGVKGSIINSMGNFFAVILAALAFKDDKMTVSKTVGCVLGFAGVVICNLGGDINTGFTLTGDGFMLIAAFCFALGGVITKVYAKNIEPALLTGSQLAIGGIALVILGLALGGRLGFYGLDCVLSMAYLAVLSAAAFTLWAKLIKYNPVGKISLFGFLNPVFGVILSGIFLGEDFLDIKLVLALVCVSAGIYIVNYRKDG